MHKTVIQLWIKLPPPVKHRFQGLQITKTSQQTLTYKAMLTTIFNMLYSHAKVTSTAESQAVNTRARNILQMMLRNISHDLSDCL